VVYSRSHGAHPPIDRQKQAADGQRRQGRRHGDRPRVRRSRATRPQAPRTWVALVDGCHPPDPTHQVRNQQPPRQGHDHLRLSSRPPIPVERRRTPGNRPISTKADLLAGTSTRHANGNDSVIADIVVGAVSPGRLPRAGSLRPGSTRRRRHRRRRRCRPSTEWLDADGQLILEAERFDPDDLLHTHQHHETRSDVCTTDRRRRHARAASGEGRIVTRRAHPPALGADPFAGSSPRVCCRSPGLSAADALYSRTPAVSRRGPMS
jgi:hypothetical protein